MVRFNSFPLPHGWTGPITTVQVTTQAGASIFAAPEHQMPQIAEAMKKNTVRDFRVERIRKRQADMAERREVAEMAANYVFSNSELAALRS